ncbi:VirB8/TrbF family protein [Burkholderia vietnamiensis]|uniref:VirB8/TrbF family protein n=1 Tax=Burkholderia vietnamiensis TaxID=60552 RepID=UPI001594D149|nr:VirB8/TrbF family protein [Burkholderia vietnamiensis]MCA8270395.1 hypothetical protein [Burkholderia vietnamiensis]
MKLRFFSKKEAVQPRDPMFPDMATTAPSNPYIEARREWMERYGEFISGKRNWQVVAFTALAIAGVSVVGNIWQAGQTKIRTYIVQVDKFNEPVKVTSADEADPSDPRYVAGQLELFIRYTRSVTTDPRVQKQWLADAYAMAGPAAAQVLNDYYRKPENDPWNRMKNETVTVTMAPATQLPGGQSWQLEWEENRYSLTGQLIGTLRYQAIITAGHVEQQEPQKYMKNISGTIAETLAWNPRL